LIANDVDCLTGKKHTAAKGKNYSTVQKRSSRFIASTRKV
jgi:hypothetical protein